MNHTSTVFTITDVFGDDIVLTNERWNHILVQHPVMVDLLEEIKLTLQEPNVVQRHQINRNEYRYYKFFTDMFGGKYVFVAVIKALDNFVATAFIVDTIRRGGELIWIKR